MKFRLKFGKKMLFAEFKILKFPSQSTMGITNKTKNGYYLLFIDYDNVKKNIVFEDSEFFQKHFGLGTSLIVKTSENLENHGVYGNYHLIFFDKLTFPDIMKFLTYARCDYAYRNGWKWHNRSWVLRIGEKRDLKNGIMTKPSPSFVALNYAKTNNVSSKAHILFYNVLLNIKIKIPKKNDNTKVNDIQFITYGSSK